MSSTNNDISALTLPLVGKGGDNGHPHEEDLPLTSASSPAQSKSTTNLTDPTDTKWILPLCIATFTHSWLLISVFPYSGFMAIFLIPSLDEENAGSYAGLLASAFMVGRAATAYGWGKVADCYGRRFVILTSLALSSIFSLLFGLSTSFGLALFWRFMLGLSNGMVGTAKTIVSELSGGNQRLETHSMSIVIGMWAWGFLASPALSGILAEPVRQYPGSSLVQSLQFMLGPFPFFLPNLVSIILCLSAFLTVWMLVPESLPVNKRRSPRYVPTDVFNWFRCKIRSVFSHTEHGTLRSDTQPMSSYGSISERADTSDESMTSNSNETVEEEEDCVKEAQMTHSESCLMLATASPRTSISRFRKSLVQSTDAINHAVAELQQDMKTTAPPPATISSLWSQKNTRNYLTVYWLYSFLVVAVDEAFPLFCISREAGLGLSEGTIGKILSGAGLLFAVCQYFVYAAIVDTFGLRRSIQIGICISAPLIFLIPVSLMLNDDMTDGSLTWETFTFLSVLLGVYRIFGLVFFSSVTVATNRTVHASHRATMNGLSMLGGSITKGLGPTFAGLLVAFCVSSGIFPPKVGAIMIFVVIGIVGLVTAAMSIVMLDDDEDEDAIDKV